MKALCPAEFDRLMAKFSPFEQNPQLCVAVSGGADSMALAILSHTWATGQGGKIICLTVDHQLRQESGAEARQVKVWLQSQGIEHHTLLWKRTQPLTGGLQATARDARYHLLSRWCKTYRIKHLLTAHHARDQLETFMMRLAKGSGLKGLQGIQAEVPTDYGRLIRPLLSIEPDVLRLTVENHGGHFISDSSNENVQFTRVRWRQLLPSLATEGLTSCTLGKTINRLHHAHSLIDLYIDSLIRSHVTLSDYGFAIIDKAAFTLPPPAFEEIVKRCLATIGTRIYPIPCHALQRAVVKIMSGWSLTLGGCQLMNRKGDLWIVREPRAMGHDSAVSDAGTYVWDQRFTVTVDNNIPCIIKALGEQGIHDLKKKKNDTLQARLEKNHQACPLTPSVETLQTTGRPPVPQFILKTLPSLWQGETLVHTQFTFTPRHKLI